MANEKRFDPKWVSPPGDTITDVLLEKKITVGDFARRIGKSINLVKGLISGNTPITIGIAKKLEETLGTSVEFWMTRDFHYRESMSIIDNKDWLSELPLSDMFKFQWITPTKTRTEILATCLRFFGVQNIREWHEKYANIEEFVSFRTSHSFESRLAAVAVWIRQGEIGAKIIKCKPWDPRKFRNLLTKVRALTRIKEPRFFLPKLQENCAKCGVAVVVIRAPSGCRASGATRFLSNDKAILQLSFRYLTDDQFWFTFFHESGHLLLHGKNRLYLEGIDGLSNIEEEKANKFAENILIPREVKTSLLKLPINSREIIRFAVKVGVSPGIVVGQLQHHKVIGPNRLNKLKRRFVWND